MFADWVTDHEFHSIPPCILSAYLRELALRTVSQKGLDVYLDSHQKLELNITDFYLIHL